MPFIFVESEQVLKKTIEELKKKYTDSSEAAEEAGGLLKGIAQEIMTLTKKLAEIRSKIIESISEL